MVKPPESKSGASAISATFSWLLVAGLEPAASVLIGQVKLLERSKKKKSTGFTRSDQLSYTSISFAGNPA